MPSPGDLQITMKGHIFQKKKLYAAKSLQLCPTFATLWTLARQAPLSMGFSRQEYWSGLPFPTPEELPDPGIERRSPTLHVDALPTELQGNT